MTEKIIKPEEWKKIYLEEEKEREKQQLNCAESRISDLLKEGKNKWYSRRLEGLQCMVQVLLKSGYAARIACVVFSNDLFVEWKLPEEVSLWERVLFGWKVPKKTNEK